MPRRLLSVLALVSSALAFAPLRRPLAPAQAQLLRAPIATPAPRSGVALQSLFGLGAPELVVILGLGAFVLGPDKLAGLAKDFGKVAGELKDVPKEFQEGIKEGEAAKASAAPPADDKTDA
mmetsp:Transcript_13925/g.41478  ORF Transcript_13925/g.41478 Transcript_13925/m.41478 type:complete len:121 (+) Transcript_13925:66-428(+)